MSSDLHRRAAQQQQEGGEENLSAGVSIPGPSLRTGRGPPQRGRPALDPLSRAVQGVFSLVAAAEFEILFVAFFLVIFLWLKDFVSGCTPAAPSAAGAAQCPQFTCEVKPHASISSMVLWGT